MANVYNSKMAGGIFVNKPFAFNIKCMIFSSLCMLLYYAGVHSKEVDMVVIGLIFVVSYIMLAWYDYIYDCNTVMDSGTHSIGTSILKPQMRGDPGWEPTDSDIKIANQEKEYLKKVYYLHALMIAPLLIYIGWRGKDTRPELFGALGGLGIMAMVYHGYRIKVPREVWA